MFGSVNKGVDRFNKMARRSCNSHEPNHSLGNRLMARENDITIDELRKLFSYNEETGILYWNIRDFSKSKFPNKWNSRYVGTEAGAKNHSGHKVLSLTINETRYNLRVHRIIWAIVKGYWPKNEIDHINCNPSDNRIINLREANKIQQAGNRGANKNNSSGFKGVWLDKRYGIWRASIGWNKKKYHLGTFNSPQEAHAAYIKAAETHYGEYARGA